MYKEKMTPRQALSTAIFLAEEAAETDVKIWKTDMLETAGVLRNLKKQFEESEERMFTSKKGQETQRTVQEIMDEWQARQPTIPPGKKAAWELEKNPQPEPSPQPEQHPASVFFADVKEIPFSQWFKQMGMSQNGHEIPISLAQTMDQERLGQLCQKFQELAYGILESDIADKAGALADLAAEFGKMVKGER